MMEQGIIPRLGRPALGLRDAEGLNLAMIILVPGCASRPGEKTPRAHSAKTLPGFEA